ncbi:MAG: orotate phosphoribosyltransferase [Armatimonadetes bacterium]|nr:orotate phosphoribosyltransferase [Armatimonadota bacterium]
MLEDSGAVLKGHFLLSSGRHSDVYFEKFRILTQPKVLSALCAEIAQEFSNASIEFVAGPTTGGIIIAFEVARQMDLPAIYVEDVNGTKTLRRGQSIPSGAKVLVVDDVLTTGLSVRETIAAVEQAGGTVVGVGVLIDRSQNPADFGALFHAAYSVDAESWAPDEVPEWLAKIPITKPGTRKS